MGLRSLFANRKPQKPLQYEDGFGEPQPQEGGTRIQGSWTNKPQPQIDIPDQGAPEVPPMDYSSALGALKGSGDASDVRYGLPQNDKPLIDARSEQDAEDLRYGYNPSNNLKPVNSPDITQPQQPAIAHAVARKRNGFNLSGIQDALNSHRMHVGDEANQMRTAFSDIGQSVPGVKPLSALDYTQGAKNDISLQQAVEEKKRQRLQDQLAYMKQLESADGQNEWAAVSHKNAMVMYNKRTGEYRPMAEFNEAGKPDTSDLATHIGKVEDRNGNIRDFQYWTSKEGKAYVTGPNGELQEVNLNDIPWANENKLADSELEQSQAERENNQKRIDSLGGLNLSDGKTIAFGGPVDQKSKDSLVSAQAVSKAYKGLMQDKEFRDLTTKGKNAKENAAKVIRLNQKMQQDGAKFQVFLAAQATAMNSGVMNVGERANYQLVLAGLPEDLLTNEAYQINKNVKAGFNDYIQYLADKAFNKKLAVEDLKALQNRVTEIAASYPYLVDPTKVRTAVKNITENAVDMAFNNIKTIGLGSNRLPAGSPFMGVDDPYVSNYFNDLKTWDDAAYEKQWFDNKMTELNAPFIGATPQGNQTPPISGNKIGASLKERSAANAAKKETNKTTPVSGRKSDTTFKTPVTPPSTPVSQTDWLLTVDEPAK